MSKRVLAKTGKTGGTTLASRKPDISKVKKKIEVRDKKFPRLLPAKGPYASANAKELKANDIKIIQAKVLEKAKKNNMTGKNFRMQNPKDKDVQALYKANPNIKVKDVDRLKLRKLEEKGNKKLVTTPRGKFIKKVNKITGVSYRAQELGIPYKVDSVIFKRVEKGGGTLAERAKKYMDALNRYAKNKKKKK